MDEEEKDESVGLLVKAQELELKLNALIAENEILKKDKEKLQSHNQELFLSASKKEDEDEDVSEKEQETEEFDSKKYFESRRVKWRI